MARGNNTFDGPPVKGVLFRSLKFLGYSDYCVGDDGTIWSNKSGQWKQRGLRKHSYGYKMVSLWNNNKEKIFYVHHLVLIAFVGPCPAGMEACHSPDPTPDNNRLSNLRWDSSSNNNLDKRLSGTDSRGERNFFARITENTVRCIRDEHKQGDSCKTIAQRYGLCKNNVYYIVTRRSWKHVI